MNSDIKKLWTWSSYTIIKKIPNSSLTKETNTNNIKKSYIHICLRDTLRSTVCGLWSTGK